jgi:dolichyl-diphosphooligosaccharide--protein glycosyltransferase
MAARKRKRPGRTRAKGGEQAPVATAPKAPVAAAPEAPVDHWLTLDRVLEARKGLLVVLAMAAVLTAGWYVRFENINEWEIQPKRFYYQEDPLLMNLDGYFYLRLARDLSEGRYDPIDRMRRFPDAPARPVPPPLMSVLVSWIHSFTSWSLNWVAVVLPALLGPILALPVYGIARLMGGGIPMRLTAALMAVLSVQYAKRTMIGFFDTDCMILTFVMGIIYCFMRFALEPKRRLLFLFLGLGLYGLLLWWWDQAPEVSTVIALFPLAYAIVLYFRPSRLQWIILAGTGTAVALAVVIFGDGTSFAGRFVARILGLYNYVSGAQTGYFPNIRTHIAELRVLSVEDVADESTGSSLVLAAAAVGAGWLFWTRRLFAGFVLVPAVLAIFPFFFGTRFLIFLAPITALGMGFLIDQAWQRRTMLRFPALALVIPLAVLVSAWPAFSKMVATPLFPRLLDRIAAVEQVTDAAPEDAVIWTSWSIGYPLMYYARRATIADGQFHDGELLLYSYLPLATDDFRLAANFMQFYVENGRSGIQKIYRSAGDDMPGGIRLLREVLSAGPQEARALLSASLASSRLSPVDGLENVDQWLRFFYPSDTPPIHLLLHRRFTTSTKWFLFGSWDLEQRRGTDGLLLPYYGVREVEGRIKGSDGLDFDRLKAPIFNIDRGGKKLFSNVPLSKMLIYTGQGQELIAYDESSRLNFEWTRPGKFGALMDEDMANSVFNQLFIRHAAPSAYFRPIKLGTPSYQVWEVRGDRL